MEVIPLLKVALPVTPKLPEISTFPSSTENLDPSVESLISKIEVPRLLWSVIIKEAVWTDVINDRPPIAYPYSNASIDWPPTPFDNSNANLPCAPPVPIEFTFVLILANDPEVFISLNEPLSITKLIVPPSSPLRAPSELLALLKSNSAPVVVSSTSLKSNTPLGSLVPSLIRGLSPDLEINKTSLRVSLVEPARNWTELLAVLNLIWAEALCGSRPPDIDALASVLVK